jgi:hypothetical protein
MLALMTLHVLQSIMIHMHGLKSACMSLKTIVCEKQSSVMVNSGVLSVKWIKLHPATAGRIYSFHNPLASSMEVRRTFLSVDLNFWIK